jgi:RNA polymerase sigma-70 factor (ECF subfamily)
MVEIPAVGTASTAQEWERVYLQFYPPVYRALVAIGARPEEAEDAMHDAFEKALRATSGSLREPSGWLFVVASRKWRQRRMRDRILAPLTLLRRTTPAPDSDRIALFDEIARLPMRERQMLAARFILGLTQEETAELLGVDRGTVSATTSKAAGKLRKRLGGTS